MTVLASPQTPRARATAVATGRLRDAMLISGDIYGASPRAREGSLPQRGGMAAEGGRARARNLCLDAQCDAGPLSPHSSLAHHAEKGYGVDRDPETARVWWTKAAEQGNRAVRPRPPPPRSTHSGHGRASQGGLSCLINRIGGQWRARYHWRMFGCQCIIRRR